jgi:outer membrane biosynthesis protein TonB
VVVACALSACSLGISAPAANRRRNQMPECDTSKGLVAIDSLGAIGLGVGGLAALGEDEGIGAVALVGAALFTAAALHGSGNADKCRAALADYSLEVAGSQPTMEVRRTPKKRRPEPEPPEQDEEPAEPEPPVTKAKLPKPAPVEDPEPAEPAAQTKPTPEPGARDWSQFWREVP